MSEIVCYKCKKELKKRYIDVIIRRLFPAGKMLRANLDRIRSLRNEYEKADWVIMKKDKEWFLMINGEMLKKKERIPADIAIYLMEV